MIPGNPPHQPRADDEPVTIHLEANEAKRHEGVIERQESQIPSAEETETPPASETAAQGDVADEPVIAAPSESIPSSTGSSGHGMPALIAAGIVGGLIALICAGAVQYAGVLPVASSSKDNQEISALRGEIDGLKQTVANLGAAPAPDAALQARVATLETAVKNAPQAASADGSASTNADPASTQKIADLTTEVDQLKSSIAQTTQNQASTGADINKRLGDAEKKLSEPGKDVAVAQAIAAAGLKAAIDRGGPFHAELDTFAGVSPDDPAVATLRNFADSGVPSRAELIHQVPEVATAIIKASQSPAPDEGWSDRLMASAKSLVTVRPVGNIQGDGVDAISARFEDKIRNGDLPGALTEWNALPDAGKSASAAFKQSIEARIKVEDLVGETLSKAIAGAGKQS
jgi:hypothetical protein